MEQLDMFKQNFSSQNSSHFKIIEHRFKKTEIQNSEDWLGI